MLQDSRFSSNLLLHLLYAFEACFRANKHDLRIRPVFHRKERRVRAHIAICYMAFCCLQHVRHRLAAHGDRMSPDRIRRALNDLQIGILHDARRSRTVRPAKRGVVRTREKSTARWG